MGRPRLPDAAKTLTYIRTNSVIAKRIRELAARDNRSLTKEVELILKAGLKAIDRHR